jgi:ATP-dependent DNA ligase
MPHEAQRVEIRKAPGALAGQIPRLNQRTFGGLVTGWLGWLSHRFEEWLPLRPVLVCEVSFSRLDGHFLRHSARFVRWRPDKRPEHCTLDTLT